MFLPRTARLPAVLRSFVPCLLVGAAWVLAAGEIHAQAAGRQVPKSQAAKSQAATSSSSSSLSPTAPQAIPSLASIGQAWRSQDYTIVQLRRFRDPQGNVETVREQVDVDASGTDTPQFKVTFLGVEGELPNSPATQKWQQTYTRFDSLFFLHSTFHVKDLGRAASNYQLHDFGPIVRANRAARRFVVWPQQLDKSVWVVDVDLQTSVPLYSAEFDPRMRLLSEVEGVSFSPATPILPPSSPTIGPGPVFLADFTSAKTYLGNPSGLVDPNVMSTSEYDLEKIEVRDDPLNGQQKLVMTYTDGIDEFMILQTPNVPDTFASLQLRTGKRPTSTNLGNTIARYRDPAMSVLIFWDGGVSFQIAGRGSLQRLDELARSLYLQARSD